MSTRERMHVSMMIDLCKTISEGAAHLVGSTPNPQLKKDTITALTVLEASLKALHAPSAAILVSASFRQCIISESYASYGEEFLHTMNIWYYTTSRTLRLLWKAGTFECPICGGLGSPFYAAVYYMERDGSNDTSPARNWMRCTCCYNCYVVCDNVKHTKRTESADEQSERYQRILACISHMDENGKVLFIGEDAKSFALTARRHALEIYQCTVENLAKLHSVTSKTEGYNFVVLENLQLQKNLMDTLEHAAGCLADTGLLWFDMPDLDSASARWHAYGHRLIDIWAADVLLTADGVRNLEQPLHTKVIQCQSVMETGWMEVVMAKDIQT